MALMCMAFLTMYVKADAQAKSKTIKTVDDLKGAKIGVQLGTTGDIYSSDYEGDKEGTTVERYNKMPAPAARRPRASPCIRRRPCGSTAYHGADHRCPSRADRRG